MSRLRIQHRTLYRFPQPVEFETWRLMMRPTDSHAIRVSEASITVSPPGPMRWGLDAYGNSVCLFSPQGAASELSIVNDLVIERYPAPLEIAWDASAFVDDEDSRALVLAPYWIPVTDSDDDNGFRQWLLAHAPAPEQDRLDFVRRLNRQLRDQIAYQQRFLEGVQAPSETARTGAGACRDVAWLMIEALRRWKFAARFVSGYLYSPGGGALGAGATHAWCEVFFSGLGWIEFDPTNGLEESPDLIRVAVTRTPEEASPVRGSTKIPTASELQVSVDVTAA